MVYFILFPLLGGTIGWLTNYLAIKFLFWPRQPIRIAGILIQGVIPRRRELLAIAVGDVVSSELLSQGQIAAAVSAPDMRSKFAYAVSEAVVAHFRSNLAFAVLPGPVRDSLLKLAGQVVDREVNKMLVNNGPALAGELMTQLDVSKLVERQLLEMDWQHIERLVFDVAGRELKYIEIMGGVLGAVIGIVQALVITAL